MKNTIIFDLDGTLLDTLEDLHNSVNFALSKYGYKERTLDEIRTFVGNGVKVLIEKALPNYINKEEFDKVFNAFKEHYSKNCNVKTKPYDDIIKIIKILKNKKYKVAVVSNKSDREVQNLTKIYFDGLVDVAVGQSDDIRKKPYPDEVFKALNILNSNEEESIYIGDSEVDVLTAKNSNLDLIAVLWGFRDENQLRDSGAKILVEKPEEILGVIEKYNE
ncbi:MAG: HAD family hydrolase [Clostridia bacterium]|nr:HAD family hydrolase [Clostridia bacterium]